MPPLGGIDAYALGPHSLGEMKVQEEAADTLGLGHARTRVQGPSRLPKRIMPKRASFISVG